MKYPIKRGGSFIAMDAFSRNARRTLRKNREVARAGGSNAAYLKAVKEGEAARLAGKPASANPYRAGTDEHDEWLFGYEE